MMGVLVTDEFGRSGLANFYNGTDPWSDDDPHVEIAVL